jgi:hypothetical protein
VKKNVKLDLGTIRDVLDKLKGACMIVYPMGLPKYDEVQAILDNEEDLSGKQAAKQVRVSLFSASPLSLSTHTHTHLCFPLPSLLSDINSAVTEFQPT